MASNRKYGTINVIARRRKRSKLSTLFRRCVYLTFTASNFWIAKCIDIGVNAAKRNSSTSDSHRITEKITVEFLVSSQQEILDCKFCFGGHSMVVIKSVSMCFVYFLGFHFGGALSFFCVWCLPQIFNPGARRLVFDGLLWRWLIQKMLRVQAHGWRLIFLFS